MEPAAFLNLDFELRSNVDLAPLASYLERTTNVLFSGEAEGTFQLTAEPMSGGHPGQTPAKCTEEMLSVLGALPVEHRELFNKCHTRAFDYGFDGGVEAPPLSVDLGSSQLSRMADLNISLRVTVYPHRAESPQMEKADA
jgi:hypothetical protein